MHGTVIPLLYVMITRGSHHHEVFPKPHSFVALNLGKDNNFLQNNVGRFSLIFLLMKWLYGDDKTGDACHK